MRSEQQLWALFQKKPGADGIPNFSLKLLIEHPFSMYIVCSMTVSLKAFALLIFKPLSQ